MKPDNKETEKDETSPNDKLRKQSFKIKHENTTDGSEENKSTPTGLTDIRSSKNSTETVENKKQILLKHKNSLPQKYQFSGTWRKAATVTNVAGVKTENSKAENSKTETETSIIGVVAAKAIAKNVRPTSAGAKPANAMSAISMAKRKPIKPKMDLAKALSMMGFGTSRTLDPSGSKNARIELNAALTRKMNDFETKRRKLLEADKKVKYVGIQKNQNADKLRDDIRTLHEAYQFLARKYIRDEEKLKEKMNGNPTDNDAIDILDELNNLCGETDENEDNDVFNKKSNNYMDNLRVKADRKKTM